MTLSRTRESLTHVFWFFAYQFSLSFTIFHLLRYPLQYAHATIITQLPLPYLSIHDAVHSIPASYVETHRLIHVLSQNALSQKTLVPSNHVSFTTPFTTCSGVRTTSQTTKSAFKPTRKLPVHWSANVE